jgi:hypothetical protein
MPKAKWGAGDNALTAADINGAERTEVQTRYSGELPRSGTYRFTIKSLKKAESNAGNPKLVVTSILDGSWLANHKQYDGCPIWDHIPVMASTTSRVANFLDAIGADGTDLMDKCIVDENGYVTKLGSVNDPAGIQVYVNVKYVAGTKEYPNPKIEVGYNGYIPVEEDGDGNDADTDGGDEPPF